MSNIELDGKVIDYDYRQSNQATQCRIDLDLEGLTVVIPEAMSLEPEQLLREKKDWVLEKVEKIEQEREKIPERQLEPGGTVPYLGEEYEIILSDRSKPSIEEGLIKLSQKNTNGNIRESIIELYREKARGLYQKFVDEYEDQIDSDYDTIYIRNQKTKWASCSSKKNLSFNLRLMMAPRISLSK